MSARVPSARSQVTPEERREIRSALSGNDSGYTLAAVLNDYDTYATWSSYRYPAEPVASFSLWLATSGWFD